MLTVNEDSRFNVPNVSAYAGSKWIYVPSGYQDIRGNSPELSNIESNLTEVTVEYLQIQPAMSSYAGENITSVKSLRHIGENIFVAWNDEKAVFFQCKRNDKTEEYKCDNAIPNLNLDLTSMKQRFMKAQVLNGIIVAITASRINDVSDIATANTTIHAHSVEDGQSVFEPLNITFAADLIELKMWEMNATIIAVGSHFTNSSKGVYGMKLNLFQKNLPKSQIARTYTPGPIKDFRICA